MHSPSIRTPSIFHLSLKQRTLHSTTLTNIYIHSLMRTKFSTVSGDDQSQHHSGINKIVKIYLYTQNTEQFIVLSHTHTHPILTLTQFKNTIHLPLELKNRKTCTPQHSD